MTTEADFEQEAQGWLHDALTDLPRVEVSTVVEHGDPSRVLLDYAVQAEVLVLGNHARGAWSEALLGSVAQQCVRQARCPVVLVPDPTHGQDH